MHGRELWRTDGTAAGTTLVKDIDPGPTGGDDVLVSYQPTIAAVGDHLYFTAQHAASGVELWRTDGTEAGTELVRDLHPTESSYPHGLSAVQGSLLYFGYTGTRPKDSIAATALPAVPRSCRPSAASR